MQRHVENKSNQPGSPGFSFGILPQPGEKLLLFRVKRRLDRSVFIHMAGEEVKISRRDYVTSGSQ